MSMVHLWCKFLFFFFLIELNRQEKSTDFELGIFFVHFLLQDFCVFQIYNKMQMLNHFENEKFTFSSSKHLKPI